MYYFLNLKLFFSVNDFIAEFTLMATLIGR